jgi:hypothetical protein
MSRLSVVMSQHGVSLARGPDAVCRAIRFAYGLLLMLMVGAGTWLLFSRI